jgi:hypothetical protein
MKNLNTFLILALCISFSIASAQTAPEIQWQNTIGGNSEDMLFSVTQTTDGGYLLGGYSYSGISGDKTETSQGGSDYWVVKLDGSGNIEWQKTIGGSDWDQLRSVIQTTDGGYLLGGMSASGISGDKTQASQGGSDYWVVKLDGSGNIEWQNTIGGNSSDYLYSVIQADDSGYLLGGYSFSGISGDKTEESQGGYWDYWVVKLDGSGNIEWQNTIGGNASDVLRSVIQTDDGGYLLGGDSDSGISGDKTEASQGVNDYWVVKLDGSGDIEWQNTIGGSFYDILYSVIKTTDGGYLLGGNSWSGISGDKTEANQGYYDYWVVKLDGSGNLEWQNTIGGDKEDLLYSVIQTIDGGYLLGGYSFSGISGDKTEANIQPDYSDFWVMKLDGSGNIEWQNTIGGNSDDIPFSVIKTTDGGYLLGGTSGSGISGDKTEASQGSADYWVVKLFADDVCLQPLSLFVTDISESVVRLEWDAVPGVLGYKVRYKATGTTQWTNIQSIDNDKTLKGLSASTEYVWQVKSICSMSPIVSSEWSEKQFFTTGSLRSGALEDVSFPIEVDVYPNPFMVSTTISFLLEQDSHVTVELFDMAGSVVHTLVHEELQSGSHEFTFDRAKLPAGMYLLKMQTPSFVKTQSIIIQ